MIKSVIGIGNALVDRFIHLPSDSVLENLNFPKGSMQLVDWDKTKQLRSFTGDFTSRYSAGGSASNTVNGLAKLGVKSGFLGAIGKDEVGKYFLEDTLSNGVKPVLIYSDSASGESTVMISQDSERTMATFLGAAVELSHENVDTSCFNEFDCLHIEGYLVINRQLVEHVAHNAKRAGMKVSIDLASFNVVEENNDFLKYIIENYVDIVFANEDEAKALTKLSAEGAVEKIGEMCDISVVKIGPKGALIGADGKVVSVKPYPAMPIDKTGAGDLFASGFFYGMCNNYTVQQSGAIGSMVAGKVIEVLGAKIDDKSWIELKDKIASGAWNI